MCEARTLCDALVTVLICSISGSTRLQDKERLQIGPGLSRAVSFTKLSRYGISEFIEPNGASSHASASSRSLSTYC